MYPFLSTLVLLAGLTQTAGTAGSSNNYAVSVSAPAAPSENLTYASSDNAPLVEQAQQSVLVIPTPDLPPDSVANLTEDMTVMCRIFDKSLPSSGRSAWVRYGNEAENIYHVLGSRSQATQGLYLDGYGALFFIHVNYPLAPTEPPQPTPTKPAEPADSVWSQTVKEMTGQPGEEQPGGRNTPPYDPQKVDSLKKALVKTLAHTANIRMRRPQDMITLVVGALDENRSSPLGRFRTTPSDLTAAPGSVPVPPGAGKPQTVARNPLATVLILRVNKADVDAFAKGQLTLAQFTDKVQTLWSTMEQATPVPSAAPVGLQAR